VYTVVVAAGAGAGVVTVVALPVGVVTVVAAGAGAGFWTVSDFTEQPAVAIASANIANKLFMESPSVPERAWTQTQLWWARLRVSPSRQAAEIEQLIAAQWQLVDRGTQTGGTPSCRMERRARLRKKRPSA
jgi:hypothetical protein